MIAADRVHFPSGVIPLFLRAPARRSPDSCNKRRERSFHRCACRTDGNELHDGYTTINESNEEDHASRAQYTGQKGCQYAEAGIVRTRRTANPSTRRRICRAKHARAERHIRRKDGSGNGKAGFDDRAPAADRHPEALGRVGRLQS
jgi:hypothetical protein